MAAAEAVAVLVVEFASTMARGHAGSHERSSINALARVEREGKGIYEI